MGLVARDANLMELIGVTGNFGEPTPVINKREGTILGLCIIFVVRIGFSSYKIIIG